MEKSWRDPAGPITHGAGMDMLHIRVWFAYLQRKIKHMVNDFSKI